MDASQQTSQEKNAPGAQNCLLYIDPASITPELQQAALRLTGLAPSTPPRQIKRQLEEPPAIQPKRAARMTTAEPDMRTCSTCNKDYDCAPYRNKTSTLCGSCRSKANGRSRCTTCHNWYTRPIIRGQYSTVPAHFTTCGRCRFRSQTTNATE